MCDPIPVTPLKMRPRYSQSSCENATPLGGTSPLAPLRKCHLNNDGFSLQVDIEKNKFCLLKF